MALDDAGEAALKASLEAMQAKLTKIDNEAAAAATAATAAASKKAMDDAKAAGDNEAAAALVAAEKAAVELDRIQLVKDRTNDLISLALHKEAVKAGLRNDKYLSLVDASAVEVKDGVVVGADKAMAKAVKDSPELFGEVDPKSGGSTKIPPGSTVAADRVKQLVDDANKRRTRTLPTW